MEFGTWLPVYGGWLRTKGAPEKPSFEKCLTTALIAESKGYDLLYFSENYLNCVYGPEFEVADAWAFAAAIGASTHKIKLVAATKPGFHYPVQLARMAQSIQQITQGRYSINIVCGWWRQEFEQCSVEYLDHEKRYSRATEFIECLKALWSGERSNFSGTYYELNNAVLAKSKDSRHSPSIWISGQSDRAISLAAEHGDSIFIDSMKDSDLLTFVKNIRKKEEFYRRKVNIVLSTFVIMEKTDRDAKLKYESLIANRDEKLIDQFKSIMRDSGAATWSGLESEDMVDSNCGLKAGLIGSPATILRRLNILRDCGVDVLVCQFERPGEDLSRFAEEVIIKFKASLDATT